MQDHPDWAVPSTAGTRPATGGNSVAAANVAWVAAPAPVHAALGHRDGRGRGQRRQERDG